MDFPTPLAVRKLADTSDGERVKRYDPETGQGYLADPATWRRDDPSTWESKPWPLAGVEIVGETPTNTLVSTSQVRQWVADGVAELEGERVVHRPSGPPHDLWGPPAHTFVHADVLVLKCDGGDVRYRVVHQPDKYAEVDPPDAEDAADRLERHRATAEAKVTPELYAAGATRVDHFYRLDLETTPESPTSTQES